MSFHKNVLVCKLPWWQNGAGFFTYPIFFINCILFCAENQDKFYEVPYIDFDLNNPKTGHVNQYLDNNGKMWENYFIIDKTYNYLNNKSLYKYLTGGEYNNIHHNFGIQTYPYELGKYKQYKLLYDKPYNKFIDSFYFNNRITANKIIKKYLKINDKIIEKVNYFWDSKFLNNNYIIGVHIRGTDKNINIGGRKIKPNEYYPYINFLMNKYDNPLIFLATDDPEYYDIFKLEYESKMVSYDNILRDPNNILFKNLDNNYKKGEDVLIDCLCLSKCDFLLHSSSAVSEFSIYFNMKLHDNNFNLQFDCSDFLKK